MNSLFKLKTRLLKFNLEIRSQGFPLNGSFLRLPLLNDESPAEIVIEIIPGKGSIPLPPEAKWYKSSNVKFTFAGDNCFLKYMDALFYIEVFPHSAKIQAPPKWINYKLPEAVLEIPLLLILRKKGYQPLHASAGLLRKGVLFPGKSACGKSTLVWRLYEIGGKLLSDDRVFLRLVNGKIEASSSETAIFNRNNAFEESPRKLTTIPDNDKITSMPPQVLIFPVFKDIPEPWLEQIASSVALTRLLPLTLPAGQKSDWECFSLLTKQCQLWELLLPSAREDPPQIRELLRQFC
jgi:hypothetical protein